MQKLFQIENICDIDILWRKTLGNVFYLILKNSWKFCF